MSRVMYALLALTAVGIVACSSDSGDSNAPPSNSLRACLERPDELPRPPTGKLPCELVPPGLSLK